MKIVLFGSSGQVGNSLLSFLSPYHSIITDHHENKRLDLQSEWDVENFLNLYPADLYINAAAFTNVDGAESSRKECFAVNTGFVQQLVKFLSKNNSPLIHLSTDYVYGNNDSDPIKENYELKPMNYYGMTKKIAEEAITNSLNNYFIFRVSWIYSHIRNNFYKSIKNLLTHKKELKIVVDQIGSPTPASYIAENISKLVKNNKLTPNYSGIYNLSASNFTSWYGFANEIVQSFKEKNDIDINLVPIKTKEYKTTALRQTNSRLDCEKFTTTFKVSLENWKYLFRNHEQQNH